MNWPGTMFFLLAAGAASVLLGTDRFPPPENLLTRMLAADRSVSEPDRKLEPDVEPKLEPIEDAPLEDPELEEDPEPVPATREERLRELSDQVTAFEQASGRAVDPETIFIGFEHAVHTLEARAESLLRAEDKSTEDEDAWHPDEWKGARRALLRDIENLETRGQVRLLMTANTLRQSERLRRSIEALRADADPAVLDKFAARVKAVDELVVARLRRVQNGRQQHPGLLRLAELDRRLRERKALSVGGNR